MKHVKFYLFGTVVLAAVIYAEQAMAITVHPTILQLSQEVPPAPKDDDQEEPDGGYECDDGYPVCEVHLDRG
ncbi:hypothetical protein EOE67_00615 [Rheinheimera riviphila]|uniref:Uncharacterized protein n=1 Tax=Rheinheimera riviphila TaxID=1834037 RepID=A0A437R4Y9_9GAMM|nr:hypothetical protein [Rheinheimera riviphila]RVU41737.1 hypothetical protein EOE67_00615 [Rheinheimera riviphila]